MEKNSLKTKLLKLLLSLVIGLIGIGVVLYFDLDAKGQESQFESYCLAEAIYFEAGNQPFIGKIAVGNVIMNRMRSEKYPSTVCDVVHQGPVRESWKRNGVFYPIRHKCQFSYWCDGRTDTPQRGSITWKDSLQAAKEIVSYQSDYLAGATHYHAVYVQPNWADHMRPVVTIEDHVFYK